MDILLDPGLWVGLLTLLVLEVVLGIDNLIFIAILADKLPPHQRDKARVIGLLLALIMRLGLLSVISWLVSLTQPLISFGALSFSGRDMILFFGGLFLLYKAVTELHERIEGGEHEVTSKEKVFASFGLVVTQIVLLDIVFSLDSVITAVGMVDNIYVMMTAVVLAVGLMLFASKPLTIFVNKNPAIVILCLSFLLMIGVSLIAEGLGFHIPKGYIYSGIGVAIVIEAFNQFSKHNQLKHAAQKPLRDRAASAIYHLMGGKSDVQMAEHASSLPDAFIPEERYMIGGVLSLSQRTVQSIMVPRPAISWINVNDSEAAIRQQILAVPHNLFPVCLGALDHVLTVMRAKQLIHLLDQHHDLSHIKDMPAPIIVHENNNVIDCIHQLQQAKGSLLIVKNDQNQVAGLVTPLDVLEAIAGEFPDEDEQSDLIQVNTHQWQANGHADLYLIQQTVGVMDLVSEHTAPITVAAFLAEKIAMPVQVGSQYLHQHIRFTVTQLRDGHIERVDIDAAA